jgi:hypothetical protein
MLYVERTIANYNHHLFNAISRIGSFIPILSKMEDNMIQITEIIITSTKIVISVMGSICHTSTYEVIITITKFVA